MATEDALSQLQQPLSIKDTAELLGLSPVTVRRYIKQQRLVIQEIDTKFGTQYMVTHIPPGPLPKQEPKQAQIEGLEAAALVARIESLNREVGLWQGRCYELESQVKLLAAPKPSLWKRIFRRV